MGESAYIAVPAALQKRCSPAWPEKRTHAYYYKQLSDFCQLSYVIKRQAPRTSGTRFADKRTSRLPERLKIFYHFDDRIGNASADQRTDRHTMEKRDGDDRPERQSGRHLRIARQQCHSSFGDQGDQNAG